MSGVSKIAHANGDDQTGPLPMPRSLSEYVSHFHAERNHQGKGNVLLFPSSSPAGGDDGPMQCRERLGGLLKYYERKAA